MTEKDADAPISVGVTVDLAWGPSAGGHVKCWERFAEQAARRPDDIDLTVYLLGENEEIVEMGGLTRLHLLPAQRGTDRYALTRGGGGGGDTDLARRNKKLARLLPRHDVIHATSPFAFGRTAESVANRQRKPFVYSVHTDQPAFTRIYAERILRRRFGEGAMGRLLIDRIDAPERAARDMARRVRGLLSSADVAMISRDADRRMIDKSAPPRKVTRLRRGIDVIRFNPGYRNAKKLKRAFGVPEERLIALFVGRIDETKGVDILAEAARLLIDSGVPLHVLVVGEGELKEVFRRAIGPNASLPGHIPQEDLAFIYASADIFVFPSHTDVSPNAVGEAKASGLPVFVLQGDGGAAAVSENGRDGVVVPNREPESWARLMRPVLEDGGLRAEMALAARRDAERRPDWNAVFEEDLLHVWRALARPKKRVR